MERPDGTGDDGPTGARIADLLAAGIEPTDRDMAAARNLFAARTNLSGAADVLTGAARAVADELPRALVAGDAAYAAAWLRLLVATANGHREHTKAVIAGHNARAARRQGASGDQPEVAR